MPFPLSTTISEQSRYVFYFLSANGTLQWRRESKVQSTMSLFNFIYALYDNHPEKQVSCQCSTLQHVNYVYPDQLLVITYASSPGCLVMKQHLDGTQIIRSLSIN